MSNSSKKGFTEQHPVAILKFDQDSQDDFEIAIESIEESSYLVAPVGTDNPNLYRELPILYVDERTIVGRTAVREFLQLKTEADNLD